MATPGRLARIGWIAAGFGCLALGVIGAFLPLMPTTIFIILAAGCFARGSPQLEAWLLDHPRFGPALRAWRDSGAISGRSKIAACAGMTLGFAVFWVGARPSAWLAAGVGAALACCAAYVVTRPAPRA